MNRGETESMRKRRKNDVRESKSGHCGAEGWETEVRLWRGGERDLKAGREAGKETPANW